MTSGFEFNTALTNLFILIISLIILIKLNNKLKLFYLFMCFNAFLGIIVHGFNMSSTLYNILWIILIFSMVITLNILILNFDNHKKLFILIGIIMSIILIIRIILDKDYIILFTIYSLIEVLFLTYKLIKTKNKYYISSLIILILFGIPIFFKFNFHNFNHNCLMHIGICIFLILFYLGYKKDKSF